MKIIIQNVEFDYNIGCRLLKLRDGDKPFPGLEDIWEDIIPYTFKEIAATLGNLEQRRIAVNCLGIERLIKEVNPVLLNRETIKKKTTWVNSNGELKTIKYNDTYELYKVKGEDLGGDKGKRSGWGSNTLNDAYYVKCKCTSTDREYMIWVDLRDVWSTNLPEGNSRWNYQYNEKEVTAVQAIAWTIQTNLDVDNIEKIVRQGDCILIKPKTLSKKGFVSTRHLTEKEYRKLLVNES